MEIYPKERDERDENRQIEILMKERWKGNNEGK